MAGVRPGRATAVADRDLDESGGEHPGHLQLRAGQRPGVSYRVAEQFADHERSVAYDGVEGAGCDQVFHELAPGDSDAGGGPGQEHYARLPHLQRIRPDAGHWSPSSPPGRAFLPLAALSRLPPGGLWARGGLPETTAPAGRRPAAIMATPQCPWHAA